MLSSVNVTLQTELPGKKSILPTESGQEVRGTLCGLKHSTALTVSVGGLDGQTSLAAQMAPLARRIPSVFSCGALPHEGAQLASAHLFLIRSILLISDDHFRILSEQSVFSSRF